MAGQEDRVVDPSRCVVDDDVAALLGQYLASAAGTLAAREAAWKSLIGYQLRLSQALCALAAALNDLHVEVVSGPPSGARTADLVMASFPGIPRSSRSPSRRVTVGLPLDVQRSMLHVRCYLL